MKKLKCVLFISITILFVSLKGLSQRIESLSEKQIKDYCRAVAIQHSSALRIIYNDLANICTPKAQIDSKVDFKTRNYVVNNLQSTVYNAIDFTGTKFMGEMSISSYLRSISRVQFSQELYLALDNLEHSINTSANANSFASNIESFIDGKLPFLANNLEKLIFAGACYISGDSYNYWNAEINNWSLIIAQSGNAQGGMCLFKGDPKSIAVADLGGAVTGLARGVYLGVTVGTMAIPGVGTVAGGACCALTGLIGGAIGSSASAGIKYLIAKIFD